MKLAVQEQWLPGATMEEKWQQAVAWGFDAIELRGAGCHALRDRLPALLEAKKHGVVMSSVCVEMDHFIGDFDDRRRADAVANMATQLEVIGELGGRGAMTPASWGMFSLRLPPLWPPPRSPEDDRAVLVDALTTLGEVAARAGVFILLEPLNRYEDHMVNTLAAGVELCQAVGLDSVKVMGDFFHMSIEEADLAESIRQAGGYLAHMHLADSNRKQPGLGHTDFRPALQALMQIGFDGYMALECHLSGEPRAALAETARYLRSMLPAAPAA